MDELEARLDALERALADEAVDFSEIATKAETRTRLTGIETQLEELTDRVAELEAATQALRGYVGNVRAVNRDVEKRADLALSKVESIAQVQGTRSDASPFETPAKNTGSNASTAGKQTTTRSESARSPHGLPNTPTTRQTGSHPPQLPGTGSQVSNKDVTHRTQTGRAPNQDHSGLTSNQDHPELTSNQDHAKPAPNQDYPELASDFETEELEADELFRPTEPNTETGRFERIRKLL